MSPFTTVEKVQVFSHILAEEAEQCGFVHLANLLRAAQGEASELLTLARAEGEPQVYGVAITQKAHLAS
ncbi:hypothetical protein [Chthonobacter albigriseus]|uniref:hypothetical protein n=1 Tax=Chthonobacter albigriseus TaxID=1683161 RepID=UPI0015EED22A|nr:hypothetical protein [Chthonobacter albigriseus]